MLRNSPIQQRNRGAIVKLRIRIPELDKIDLAVRRSPIKICNVDVHFQSTRQRGHLNVVYNPVDARAGEMRLREGVRKREVTDLLLCRQPQQSVRRTREYP